MLEVRDLSVSFGGVRAVDHVSINVPSGTIVGLIGPNGAGKTTVFDAICGFIQPDFGRVLLGDRDLTSISPSERARAGLGRSFQDGRLFPSMTVAECLATAMERHLRGVGAVSAALRVGGTRRSERRVWQRVDELIEMMGLGAFRDKFVSELSTGTRRIVDLACVMAHDPSVLLLDEPSSGIAQRETEALGPLLISVKEATGCTMLLVEHDMPLVTTVSDELVAMDTGHVIARGTPKEVISHPAVIESYLGSDEQVLAKVKGSRRTAARGVSDGAGTRKLRSRSGSQLKSGRKPRR